MTRFAGAVHGKHGGLGAVGFARTGAVAYGHRVLLRSMPRLRAHLASARRHATGALALLLALVLVVGALRAGSTYFYCPLMGAVASRPCCEQTHQHADGPELAQAKVPSCCEEQTLPRLPASSPLASQPCVGAAPELTALVLPAVASTAPEATAPPPSRFLHRGCTSPPLASQACTERMVFLI
jgi:hypothetical protein